MLAVVGSSLVQVRSGALFALPCTHKIRKDLPHLKAIIQYLGTPPAEEGVYEVSAPPPHWCEGSSECVH